MTPGIRSAHQFRFGFKSCFDLRAITCALVLCASGGLSAADTPPAAPGGLTATAGKKSIALDWRNNTESDLAFYWVYRSETPGTGFLLMAYALTRSSYNDIFAEEGVRYYYRVFATDDAGNVSASSAEVSAMMAVNPVPITPTGLQASAEEDAVVLDWTNNSDPDLSFYSVFRTTTPGSNYELMAYSLQVSNYTDIFAEPGTTYYYSIAAEDDAGKLSSLSPEVQVTTPGQQVGPSAPTGLTATAASAAINLNWNDNPGDAASYAVYRSTTSGSGFALLAHGLTQSAHSDRTAQAGRTYYYCVAAVDAGGNASALSSQAWATIPVSNAAPAVPTGLTATAGSNSISLNWNDNTESDLAGYSVFRSTTSGTGFTLLAENVTQSAYTDSAVQAGTTYFYIVFASDGAGNTSAASAQVSAKVTAAIALTKTLGWTAPTTNVDGSALRDLAGYKVHMGTSSRQYTSTFNAGNATQYTVGPLTPGTYYFSVTSLDNSGNESPFSTEVSYRVQ